MSTNFLGKTRLFSSDKSKVLFFFKHGVPRALLAFDFQSSCPLPWWQHAAGLFDMFFTATVLHWTALGCGVLFPSNAGLPRYCRFAAALNTHWPQTDSTVGRCSALCRMKFQKVKKVQHMCTRVTPKVPGCKDLRARTDFLPSSVFQRDPLSMLALGHPHKPRNHGARPRWVRHVTHDSLEKWLEHLRHPEPATSPSAAASLERTERNYKGLSPGNTRSGWPAERDLLPGSPESAAVWALALSWWSSRPWVPLFGRRAVRDSKTLGWQNVDVPLGVDSLLSWSELEIIWPNLAKTATSCFEVLLDLLEFHGWDLTRGGKSRLKTVAGFPGHTSMQKSRYPWRCPRPALTCLRPIFDACERTTPFPYSVPRSAAGALKECSASIHPGDDGRSPIQASRWKIRIVCYLIFRNSWVFVHQKLQLGHVLFGSQGDR